MYMWLQNEILLTENTQVSIVLLGFIVFIYEVPALVVARLASIIL